MVVGGEGLAERDWNFVFLARFLRRDENQVRYVEVEGCVGAVVGDVGIRHWESEVRRKE